jgi:sigma-54 dependent transcriptional regulator, acetoin dehydrogenase operon transcriptional activator AcoR
MKAKQVFPSLSPDDDRQTMAAWDRFLRSGELPANAIRNLIEHSWWRCHSAGVDPERFKAPDSLPEAGLRALHFRYRDLIEASVPIMAQARDFLSESGTIMILTDPTGIILETEGDPATRDTATGIRLAVGANWNELSVGTNAIGTALTVGEPVQVHASEHFCEGIKPWTCSATVVRDPSNGEVLGVLDVSGLRGTFNRHSLALVVAAAGRIEGRLAGREMELRQRLLESGLGRLSRVASGGLIFFDRKGRFIKADARAGLSLSAMGIKFDLKADTRVDAFNADNSLNGDKAELPDGLRAEWTEKVVERGEYLGTVIVLPEPFRRGVGQRAAHVVGASTEARTQSGTCLDRIIGTSELLLQAVDKAKFLAEVDVPVLLQGETGVGKEVFARAIHEGGRRRSGPFVALNCGGLPRDILASELFGYVDGAFSGARRSGMVGKIEAANGGTLFLDEIGEMPFDLQPYLLRVVEGGEVYPLGDSKPRRVQFRLVVATNRDLRAEIAAGRFRMDLFYRISVTSLSIPALRDRKQDITALVEHFSNEVTRRHGVSMKQFDFEVLAAFERYAWPGNVRELRNVVEGMVLMARGEVLTLEDLPVELSTAHFQPTSVGPSGAASGSATTLEAVESDAIRAAVLSCRGNLTRVAQELRISKSTLYLKIKKYGLEQILPEARHG